MQSLGQNDQAVAILKAVIMVGGTPLLIGTLAEVFSGKLNVDLVGKEEAEEETTVYKEGEGNNNEILFSFL